MLFGNMAIEKKTNKVAIDINVQLIGINEVGYTAVWIEATSIKKINGNSRGIYKCGCRINQLACIGMAKTSVKQSYEDIKQLTVAKIC